MTFANFIRGIVKAHPELKLKLKKANSSLSPFQYVYQSVFMTGLSTFAAGFIVFLFTSGNLFNLMIGMGSLVFFSYFIYKFWFSYVDVEIRKLARELDEDLLFVSEYLLVSLESGLPLGNSIENLSKIDRPGGKFFKRVYTEFKTGKSFEDALYEAERFSASDNMKTLIKRLRDSLEVGVDLREVLKNFIQESSERKLLSIKAFSKKLNPIVMMYLLMGVVLPSLGVTFFILGAAMLEITAAFLKIILIGIFLLMFAFQYFAYSMFKFTKSII